MGHGACISLNYLLCMKLFCIVNLLDALMMMMLSFFFCKIIGCQSSQKYVLRYLSKFSPRCRTHGLKTNEGLGDGSIIDSDILVVDVGDLVTDDVPGGYTESLPSELDISACSGDLPLEGVDYQTFAYSLSISATDGEEILELSALCQNSDSEIYVAIFSMEAPIVCNQHVVPCGTDMDQLLDVGDYTIVVTGKPGLSDFEFCAGCGAAIIAVDLDIGVPETELGDGGGSTDSLPSTDFDIASCEGVTVDSTSAEHKSFLYNVLLFEGEGAQTLEVASVCNGASSGIIYVALFDLTTMSCTQREVLCNEKLEDGLDTGNYVVVVTSPIIDDGGSGDVALPFEICLGCLSDLDLPSIPLPGEAPIDVGEGAVLPIEVELKDCAHLPNDDPSFGVSSSFEINMPADSDSVTLEMEAECPTDGAGGHVQIRIFGESESQVGALECEHVAVLNCDGHSGATKVTMVVYGDDKKAVITGDYMDYSVTLKMEDCDHPVTVHNVDHCNATDYQVPIEVLTRESTFVSFEVSQVWKPDASIAWVAIYYSANPLDIHQCSDWLNAVPYASEVFEAKCGEDERSVVDIFIHDDGQRPFRQINGEGMLIWCSCCCSDCQHYIACIAI